jgi:hypothetical protein
MAILRPVFTVTAGSFRSDETTPAGGPASIVIDRDMNASADLAEIVMMDRSGIAVEEAVSIELGHDGRRETVFTGNVISVRSTLQGAHIRALGKMRALLDLRTAAFYENQSVGTIVSDLISQAGLSEGTIDDGPTLPRFAVDRRVSAYRHVRGLAGRLGFELYTDRSGNVMFHGLGNAAGLDAAGGLGAVAGAAASALGLGGSGEGYEFGKHLLSSVAVRRTASVETIEIGGESPMSSQGDTTSYWLSAGENQNHGQAGGGGTSLLFMDPAARTKDLADRFAGGHLAARARRHYQIEATVLGRSSLELGNTVQLSGVPDELINGSGYVRAIRHSYGAAAGFITTVRISVEAAS